MRKSRAVVKSNHETARKAVFIFPVWCYYATVFLVRDEIDVQSVTFGGVVGQGVR